MKWVSTKSPKILKTNVHIHFHTFCEPPGNFTFLSHMLSTVSILKESPALCSLDFSLSVGLHSVNAQSPLQSLCPDGQWACTSESCPWTGGLLWVQIERAGPPKTGYSWLLQIWQAWCCLWGSPDCSHVHLPSHWSGLTTSSYSAPTLLPPQAASRVRSPRKFSWDIQKYLRRWGSLFLHLAFLYW